MTQLMALYKKSKEEFIKEVNNLNHPWSFADQIDINEFQGYRELIDFFETLLFTNVFTEIRSIEVFTKVTKILSDAYNNDKEAYLDFISHHTLSLNAPKPDVGLNFKYNYDIRSEILYHYLPSFYQLSDIAKKNIANRLKIYIKLDKADSDEVDQIDLTYIVDILELNKYLSPLLNPPPLVVLYRESKEKFIEAVNHPICDYNFWDLVDINKFQDYRELIDFLETLFFTNVFTKIGGREFFTKAIEILSDAYNNDKAAYIDFISNNVLSLNSKCYVDFESHHNIQLEMLYHYLPSFYQSSDIVKKDAARIIKNYIKINNGTDLSHIVDILELNKPLFLLLKPIALYKESKEDFIKLVNEMGIYNDFWDQIDINEFQGYRELIDFFETLLFTKILKTENLDGSEKFLTKSLEILSDAYNQDKQAYIDFMSNYPIQLGDSKESFNFNSTRYGEYNQYLQQKSLYHYLPSFYHSSEIFKKDVANKIEECIRIDLLNPSQEDSHVDLTFIVDILELNKHLNPLLNPLIPEDVKLKNAFEKVKETLGVYELYGTDCVLTKKSSYSLLHHKDTANKAKKALVIYGVDDNGAFRTSTTEFKLFLEGYDVLILDAKKKILLIEDIVNAIIASGFSDLDSVHINMHGGSAELVTDTLFELNKWFTFWGTATILASDLFAAITATTGEKAIKYVVYSCHSQLITHKIAEIISIGSEIITLSEDQVVNNNHYKLNGFGGLYDPLVIHDGLLIETAKSFYGFKDANVPSATYGKIGECNFRTPVNLTKKDIEQLLMQVPRDEVIHMVVESLKSENNKEEEDIQNHANKLFDMVLSSSDSHPLLSFRAVQQPGSTQGESNKYLSIASVIYAIYDQCGEEKVISDSDFTPNQDNFLGKATFFALGLLLPNIIQDCSIWGAGKIIEYLSGESANIANE